MTEKAKREHAHFDARKYWIGFSILFVLLLFPFRVTYHIGWYQTGWLVGNFYKAVTVLLIFVVLWFLFKFRLNQQRFLTGLVILCIIMSSFQAYSAFESKRWNCSNYTGNTTMIVINAAGADYWEHPIFEPVWCSHPFMGACCLTEYIKFRHIPITIEAGWFHQLSPNSQYIYSG